MLQKIIIFTLTLVLFSVVVGQDDPPAAAPQTSKNGTEKPKTFSWGSVKNLPLSPPFVSFEGKFSIGLKTQIDGYAGLSPKEVGFNASGSQFTWEFDEGKILVMFLDASEVDLKGTDEELQQITKKAKDSFLSKITSAKLKDETFFRFGIFPASNTSFDLPDNKILIQRFYLVKNRMYQLDAFFQDTENEKYINAALDSFKLISQKDIDDSIQKKYETMKPAPLPQEPVVPKVKSDAEDEGLKGKIKKIVEEREDIHEGNVQKKEISHVYYFNQSGNFTQRDYYDSQGNPFQITVYGYIDGKRVSKSKTVRYEYDPPPMAAPKNNNNESQLKRDLRYDYGYEYQYSDGYLAEETLILNNGNKGMRYVYNHKNNQIEKLVYTTDGELNQKYLSLLDDNGNEIEKITFDLSKAQYYGNRKYRYEYEFDAKGNWIKQTGKKEVIENGVASYKIEYVKYRTITYW